MILRYGCEYFRRKLRKAFRNIVINHFISGFDRDPYDTEVHLVTTAQNSDDIAITRQEILDVLFEGIYPVKFIAASSGGRILLRKGVTEL